ncbi:hypothetical protein [Psychrobacillus sp. MER TA 171]|uniref:hypothetical protein n=1 Tax=Psychrobacillus sp. MER TA 171 TaxID=2939577 RepID=UPI00203B5C28|nr:hypothetical protein [Psychrobacillus sp. MER TA 171]MCM3357121.1 hypothetical protein [Psychrobacillus sp. MER TA 171]
MTVLFLGFILFLSLSIGCIAAYMVYGILHQKYEKIFGLLCGLLLIGLLVFEIVPEALESFEKLGLFLGFFCGYCLYSLIIPHRHVAKDETSTISPMIIGLFLHTIPLSLTIGTLLHNDSFPLSVTASTVLHHIPEGFALTTLFLLYKKKIIGLMICFLSLSICFISFIWIGEHLIVSTRIQGIFMGVSIYLISTISLKEFIVPLFKGK